MSFGVAKFRSLLVAGSFTVLAAYVVRITDALVAGNLLGADALAGVNLVGPALSIVSFVAGMVASGMATNYSLAMGRCDKTRARQFFMQGVWSALALGGVWGLLMLFGADTFLACFDAPAAVKGFARDYLVYSSPVAVLEGALMLLVSLGYADGDEKLCMLGYLAVFAVNLAVSFCGARMGFGTAGCAVGSVLADAAGILILSAHFFRPTNSFRPVRHFRLKDTVRIVRSSFGDAAAFLCDGLLFLFLNLFVVRFFGASHLPTLAVVTTLWGLLQVFNGIGVAIQPIVTVYYAEGNMVAARRVMNAAMRMCVYEGVALMVLFECCPGAIARLFGLADAVLLAEAVQAIRFLGLSLVCLAFAGVFNSYYMFVEHPALAGCVTFLCYLVLPIACAAIGALAGVGGVWAGLGLGPTAGALLSAAIVFGLVGRRLFPLLLPRDRDATTFVHDLALNDFEITSVSRQIAALPGVPMKAALLVEEVFEVVKDRNAGRKILGEATVDLADGVKLTLRDDGEIFDITDADQRISSLRTFLVASMMLMHEGRLNLVTTGFNRNVFRFT